MTRSRRKDRGEAKASAPGALQGARPRVLLVVAAVALLAVCVLAAALLARRGASAGGIPRGRDNLLLVTLDTTRADRLGCYGYAPARTRHLDRLAAAGVRFDSAFTTAPITLPAHASIFTGLYPPSHGVRNNGNFYLGQGFPTLATILRAQGYRTAAFVSSFILDRRYGLARGFETYDDAMQGAERQVVALEAERRGDRTALALSAWLRSYASSRSAPFFAWLHLYDPHEPYRPPPPFREAFADNPYDGEVAFDDAVVASILDELGRLGLLDRTLVAVIGDHGESLGDHGEETHSMFVYESAIRVPFFLWRPGVLPPGVVVKQPVRAVDLAPTLLDLLGAPPLPKADGRSLVAAIEGRDTVRPTAYAETFLPQLYMNWSPLRAIRDERFKLIEAPRPELYDLLRDPGEQHNLYSEQAETARALGKALAAVTGGGEGAMSVGALDREAVEKLAALGYVGAGAALPGAEPGRTRVDPKDVIAVFNRLRRANSAVRDRRFAEALPILHDVLHEDPRNAFAQLVLGSAHMGMGECQQAIVQYRRYLELVPRSSYAHQWIAICCLRLGDREGALRETEAALAIDPRFSDARVLRGGVLASRGAYDGAIKELRAAVSTDPAKPMIRLDLAKVLAEAGHTAEAQAEYETILRLQPDYAPALTGLGALRAKQGALEEAARDLRRALELDPRLDDARFDLAQVLERQGRPSEAVTEYRQLADAPGTPPAIRRSAQQRMAVLGR